MLASPVASQIKLYEDALAAYQEAEREAERQQREAERARWRLRRHSEEAERTRRRKLHDYWMSLDGDEFEQELGTLYRYLGYRVESTPSSGDQGVDLILRKNGKTTVVQCKSHQAPVGPAVARELLGSLVASGADNAILACTGGFTRGVKEFVRGKRIALVLRFRPSHIGRKCRGQDAGHNEQSTRLPRAGMWKRDGSAGRETRQILGVPEIPQMQRD